MGQGTMTLQEAVAGLDMEVSMDEAKQDIADGLLITASHSDEVVWIGDWFRWFQYRQARNQFPPEKREEFRLAMIEALARSGGPPTP